MSLDLLLSALLLGLAAGVVASLYNRTPRTLLAIAASTTALALGALLWLQSGPLKPRPSEAQIANRPIMQEAGKYVSSDRCRSCHPDEYQSWRESHHAKMTQRATPETVLAPFDGIEFDDGPYRYQLSRRGDEFFVRSNDPEFGGGGDWVERRVVITTGSHHAQIFWLETGMGRKVELFPFAYRVAEERWVPFLSAFLAPKVSRDHAGLVETSWSLTCIRCHATNARPRVDSPTDIDSRVSEFGIACEACHGPGLPHIERNQNPLQRYTAHLGTDAPDESIVQPAKLSHARGSEVCAQCHSVSTEFNIDQRRKELSSGYAFRPGQPFEESRNVVRNDGNPQIPYVESVLRTTPGFLDFSFWPDGEVAVSGREYNAMTDSPCYRAGEMTCFSCHRLHRSSSDPRTPEDWADDQVALGMRGNAACLQCHEEFEERLESHTHHARDSAGSECMNCHMPNTAYGLLKTTRSHQVTNPTVAAELASGRPNACNLCHLDKTLEWTAEAQHAWWGTEIPELSEEQRTTAASLLALLRGHAGQRAVVVWSMGWEPAREASGTEWMTPFLARLLVDPYEAIRFLANRSAQGLPGYEGRDVSHTAPETELQRTTWDATEAWSKAPRSRTGREILIDANGNLMSSEIDRLIEDRDERFVYRPE